MEQQRPGRPWGFSPGHTRKITHEVGIWTWNTDNLHKRITKTNANECWTWTGSKTPAGNIFGAYKNQKPQMTQPNRLIYMEQVNKPIDDINITMRCQNRFCCNPNHFEIKPRKPKKQTENIMMLIKENLYTEGHNEGARLLTHRLKEFFQQHPFANGLDWNTQTLWATMTPEQCTMFCLKYPEYSDRFTQVKE